MVFNNIKIKNFRGVKELKIEDFKRVNIFVGDNNSGKTSVLEALFLISSPSNPAMAIRIANNRKFIVKSIENLNTLFYNLNYKEEQIEILVHQTLSNDESNVEKKLIISLNENINISNQINNISNQINNINVVEPMRLEYEYTREGETIKRVLSKVAPIKLSNIHDATFQIEGGKDDIDMVYTSFFNSFFVTSNHSRAEIDMSIKTSLDYLATNIKIQEILGYINKFDSKHIIKDIRIIETIIYLQIEGLNKLLPINFIGDGFIKYIHIIILMYTSKDSVLLIDEIENGLHYSKLEELWNVILTTAKEFNVQLFITSHSLEIIQKLIDVTKKKGALFMDDIKCFKLKLYKNNNFAYAYDFDSIESHLENQNEIR